MSTVIEITRGERGVTRVFAVNLPWDEAQAATPNALLGTPEAPEGAANLFAVRDLADIGLTGYLTEGMGLPKDQIDADKDRLSALDGHVLVLRTNALQGRAFRLTPGPALTLIGTYHETVPAPDFTPLTSDAAKGSLAPPPASEPVRAGLSKRLIAALFGMAIVLFALLTGAIR